jgi:hypothetical protein
VPPSQATSRAGLIDPAWGPVNAHRSDKKSASIRLFMLVGKWKFRPAVGANPTPISLRPDPQITPITRCSIAASGNFDEKFAIPVNFGRYLVNLLTLRNITEKLRFRTAY